MIYKQHAEGTVWKIPSYWPINGMLCYVMLCHVMSCYVWRFQSQNFFMAVTAVAEDSVCLQYDAEQIGTRNLAFGANVVSSPSKMAIQSTMLIH